MAKAKAYTNVKGKRRVLLELTGKEAAWLYAVAWAENGDGDSTPDWTVFDALFQVMDFAPDCKPAWPQTRPMIVAPPVTWKGDE